MPEARFEFVERMVLANAAEDDKTLHRPARTMLGEQALDVDIDETKDSLTRIFRHRDDLQINIIPKASHGLLKAETFNQQVPF